MPGNQLTTLAAENLAGSGGWKTKIRPKNCAAFGLVLLGLAGSTFVMAGEGQDSPPRFVGSAGCSASSCHGGGGSTQSEFTRWSKLDFHHERPFATLTTPRAARIAENLKISDPTQDARCTVCHAPLQTVPAGLLSQENKITDGVSCENCHAPAENWLRSHTRKDWTTAERVQAGMRDLKNLYVRANTCVACHQNVDAATRAAGHPELIFELDGQSATEPRHWPKAKDKPGPQIWLVGQAVALREMSWQLSGQKDPDKNLREQSEGLLRLLQPMSKMESHLPAFEPGFPATNADAWSGVQRWSDDFAKTAANLVWSDDMTRQCLKTLAGSIDPLADPGLSTTAKARYAERLVLALDRLTASLAPWSADAKLNRSLNQLFDDVQSLPDFAPLRLARDLNEFRRNLSDVSQ
ncbi:MAG: multiheme c-type cytochrome [Verrucomicrobiota bacterium]